jgi:4-diphosphocytidyl-2-C-methyl-D-erythritol kinase
MVLALPAFGVDTAWAYRNVQPSEAVSPGLLDALAADPLRLDDLLAHLVNDLEAPAVERHPEIQRIRERLLDLGARAARMTGSGSAVFGLFPDAEQAENAAQSLRQAEERANRGIRTFVATSVDVGSEVESVGE